MAASIASHSYGSTLGYGSSTASFTSLAEVVDITADLYGVGKTKVTNLGSPNATHEYVAALGEPGTVSLTINYDKTTYNTLYGFYRVLKYWKIAASDSGNVIGYGFITKLPVKIPDDDRITDDIEIQFVAKPAFATS